MAEKKNDINSSMNDSDLNNGKVSVVPQRKMDTKCQIIQMAISAIAIIVGVLYLKTNLISLSFLLPLFCVLFTAMPCVKMYECKKLGQTAFVYLLPSICYFFLSAVVIIATIYYFVVH